MRPLLLLPTLLAACSQQPEPAPSVATGTFAGEGRDRLCIAGDPGSYRGGVIVFGAGDANCSASGKIEAQAGKFFLVPRGEGECRIPLTVEGNVVRVGDLPPACSYYCGPAATLSGKSFNRADMGSKAVDLGGDPLC